MYALMGKGASLKKFCDDFIPKKKNGDGGGGDENKILFF